MKKIYALLLFLSFHSYICFAQQTGDEEENKVEMVKMAYMTKELNLTPQEAQNFWPVYNNYQNELKQARSKYPNDEVAFEKKAVEIKERYQGNFKKVLGNQRANKVYTSDKQFNNTLRNELNNRRKNTQNFQQQRLNQTQKDNGNNIPNKNIKRGNGNKKPHTPF
ncbi:MAG: hypothetical protein JST21_16970 [Bacteroidetes bacterium]|nr:hypothetical protein [Bacteroidota bacterium]